MAKYLVTTRVACIIDADCIDSAYDYWDSVAYEMSDLYQTIYDNRNETVIRELFD